MERVKIKDIVKWTKGNLRSGEREEKISSISIDSRTLKKGDFFIPLKGENFDGHNFIDEALRKGARGFLMETQNSKLKTQNFKDKVVIQVENTRRALGDIALCYRKLFSIPLIAITGSAGKTMTKEMVSSLLSRKFSVLKSPGNFNNDIGLPLTLIQIDKKKEILILEMGISRKGEMERLCEIASPNFGLITAIYPAHLGFFKSQKEIALEKGKLLNCLNKEAFLNQDSRYFSTFSQRCPVKFRTFGIRKRADFFGTRITHGEKGIKFLLNDKLPIFLPVHASFLVYNALGAIAIAKEFGILDKEIQKTLSSFSPISHRFSLYSFDGVKVIDDTYNANPASFRMAVKELKRIPSKRRIVVSAEMKELGRFKEEMHYKLGKFLSKNSDILFVIGEGAREIYKGAKDGGLSHNFFYKEKREAAERLKKIIREGDLILIKGSRANKLEEICSIISSIH